jgi:hypothetical protein
VDPDEEAVWVPQPKRQRIEAADDSNYNFT